jgi:hypothetical protein
MLRRQHLMFEVVDSDDERNFVTKAYSYNSYCSSPSYRSSLRAIFLGQLSTRELLFGKLLTEFANLIKFEDKLVIQRAAAIQALCGGEYLST